MLLGVYPFTIITGVALLAWSVLSYNRLVRDRNRVTQAWSDVDVQLVRRHDLVPRLVEMVKSYANYERTLLESLSELRSRGAREPAPGPRGDLESSLGKGLQRLVVLVEGYPGLQASRGFLDLQCELAETENQIQFARRYYNGAVNAFNTQIDRFPDLLVARLFRFARADFFELEQAQAAVAPPVSV
jgi:LemA protein